MELSEEPGSCEDQVWFNLISRLYDVTDGEILVGGKNVKEYDLEVLRNQVSVVLQKNVLFTGSILDNLRWGDKEATDEECIQACKLACADEFIERFPDKYNTHIEQGRKQCVRWSEAETLYCKSIAKEAEDPDS